MGADYLQSVREAAEDVRKAMLKRGFSLAFGGEGELPTKKPRAPTDARSEFLANKALGDWAEQSLAAAIREADPKIWVGHYGQSDSIAAGEEGFADFYRAGLENVRLYGKRPDLLLFDENERLDRYGGFDISMLGLSELDELARLAKASIEVRSSKVDALKYMAVRKADREGGKKASRDAPSFTVKAEDLVVVYRWLERYGISQAYVQVFFDSVWGMNVLDIFRWIAADNFKIENPDKSQGKATILVPITQGCKLGVFTETPEQRIRKKVTRLGRHDSYIEPVLKPGNLKLNMRDFRRVVRV